MEWFQLFVALLAACFCVGLGDDLVDIYKYEVTFTQLDRTENTAVANIVYQIRFGDSSSAKALWQLRVFACENIDGTGERRLLSTQVLTPNTTWPDGVGSDGRMLFEISPVIQLEGVGYGTNLPYICLAVNEHPDVSSVLTSCNSFPQELARRAEVESLNYGISFTHIASAKFITEVSFELAFGLSSDVIYANPMWQMMLFASQNVDGTDPVRMLSRQLLDENQVSPGVRPGGSIRFRTTESIDYSGTGPGTSLLYLCLSLQKHPSADFMFVFRERNVITECQPLPFSTVQPAARAVIKEIDPSLTLTRPDESSTYVIVNVTYGLLFDASSDVIDENPLWRMMLYASPDERGTGQLRMISRQLLHEDQMSASVRPGSVIYFTASGSFDFHGLGPGNSLPYLCLSLGKHPSAGFELFYGGSNVIAGCQPVPFSVEETPSRTAVVKSVGIEMGLERQDQSSTYVITNVSFHLQFDISSDVIVGNPLWQLILFASQNIERTGPVQVISRQILDENQASYNVIPGGEIRFTTSDSFDFAGLGPGTFFPYICLSLEKHRDADFELEFANVNVISGCQPIPLTTEQPPPRAVVSEVNADISFDQPDVSSTTAIVNVNFEVMFDSSSDDIDGNALWQLMLFASQSIDGSSLGRMLSTQLLEENQIFPDVAPGAAIRFSTIGSFDFQGLGPGTDSPYICLSFKMLPSADFELVFGDRDVITRCTEIPQLETAEAEVNCPEGYTTFEDSCYIYYRRRKGFKQSKNYCVAHGGHLVTITSQAENNFVSELTEGTSSWIGAERNHSASFTTYTSNGNDNYRFLPNRIPRGVGSLRFGVEADSDAYIILSPARDPDENTPLYEFAIGARQNKKSFIRRCMNCPAEDTERKPILKRGQETVFFINFQDGIITMGKQRKSRTNLNYRDEEPIEVNYVAFKTVGTEGTWKFYDNQFMWITNEMWGYEKYRFGEPGNTNNREHCLETNYDSNPGIWNDRMCSEKKTFVCEIERE